MKDKIKGKMKVKGAFPAIIEQTQHGERVYDIATRLLKDRIILFNHESIDTAVAETTMGQLLYLDAEDPDKEIVIYINSPGGSVTDGLAIYDTIQLVKAPVCTVCVGQACSMGAVLLAAGRKGKRYILPNARVMLHQVWTGRFGGNVSEATISVSEMKRLNDTNFALLSKHTGKPIGRIKKDCMHDKWFSPQEAKDYGLVDKIVSTAKGIG